MGIYKYFFPEKNHFTKKFKYYILYNDYNYSQIKFILENVSLQKSFLNLLLEPSIQLTKE